MVVKVFKDVIDALTSNIGLEHRYNHLINSLESFDFKMVSNEVKREVSSLFANSFAPS